MGSVVAGFLSKTTRNVGTLEYTVKTPVSVKKANDGVSWDLPPQRGRWEPSSVGWWPGHDGSEPLLDWTSPACSISCPHHTYTHMSGHASATTCSIPCPYETYNQMNEWTTAGEVDRTALEKCTHLYDDTQHCFSSYRWAHFSRAVLYSQRSWVLSATTVVYHIHTILRDGPIQCVMHRQHLNFASLCCPMPTP